MPDGSQSLGPPPVSRNVERDILYALTGLDVPKRLLGADGLPVLTLPQLERILDEHDLADPVGRLERVSLVGRHDDGRISASPGTVHLIGLLGYSV